LKQGTPVILDCPDNPVMHGREAEIVSPLTFTGADGAPDRPGYIVATGTGSGELRVFATEVRQVSPVNRADRTRQAREEGFTGDMCFRCGSRKVKRNGACLLCCECGETSGCS
jgi:hypothetical protein